MATQALRDYRVARLSVDPIAIAEAKDVAVREVPLPNKMLGFIMHCGGNRYAIGCNSRLENPGLKSFTIAHELGHYCIDDHPLALLSSDIPMHGCAPEQSATPFERETDCFASELLMPAPWFKEAAPVVPFGIDGIRTLTNLCRTSFTATANRYTRLSPSFCLSIVTQGERVKYGFLSKTALAMIPHRDSRFLKGRPVPENSATYHFNKMAGSIAPPTGDSFLLSDWLPDAPAIPVREEVQGLGRFGTLTLLTHR